MLDIRRSTGSLLLIATVAQVILISAQVQSKSGVRVLQVVTFGVFSRVQGGAFTVIHGTRNLWSNYFALRGARVENETLKKQLAELEVRLQEQRALAARSVELQKVLDLRVNASLPTVAATVIAGNPNPGLRTITIDRGSADGVLPDMAVIAPQGVVGRVVGPVAAHAARVQLLIDRNAAAGALAEATRAGGLVVGVEQDPPMVMELVSNLEEIKPGDLIVASGVDGIYPKGIAIGKVEKSEKGAGLYRTITVRPTVDFSSLEDVLVVMVPPRPATPEEKEMPAAPAAAASPPK